MDRQTASKGQLQIFVKKNTKKEAGGKKEVKGEGNEDVRDKAYPNAKSHARARFHKS